MIEFTFELGPLRLRFAVAGTEQGEAEDEDNDGYYVEVTSDTERVDYPPDTEVDWIGFRPS